MSEDVGLRPVLLMELKHGKQFKAENTFWRASCFALTVSFVLMFKHPV